MNNNKTQNIKYLKFGVSITTTFLMWLIAGSLMSLVAKLLGADTSSAFNTLVASPTSITFLIALAVFYFHRKIFKRDVFTHADTGHLMVLATSAFLPIFVYLTCVSLIDQLLSLRFLSLAILGDTLRHNFMVLIPVYFITLVMVAILVSGLLLSIRKLLKFFKK